MSPSCWAEFLRLVWRYMDAIYFKPLNECMQDYSQSFSNRQQWLWNPRLDICLISIQICIRAVLMFGTTPLTQIIWYDYSKLVFSDSVFSLITIKLMAFSILVIIYLHYTPPETVISFFTEMQNQTFVYYKLLGSRILVETFKKCQIIFKVLIYMAEPLILCFAIAGTLHVSYRVEFVYAYPMSALLWGSFLFNSAVFSITMMVANNNIRFGILVTAFGVFSFGEVYKRFNVLLKRRQLSIRQFWRCFVHFHTIFVGFKQRIGWLFIVSLVPYTFLQAYVMCWFIYRIYHLQEPVTLPLAIAIAEIIMENIIFFIIHFFMCNFSSKIHSSAKILISRSFKYRKFHQRWLISRVIERIHTKKMLGFTYASFANMSHYSYLKYFFIFCNLLIKVYKFQTVNT